MLDDLASGQQGFRDGDDEVFVRIGGINEYQFGTTIVFRVGTGLSFIEADLAFNRKDAGKETSCKEKEDAEVGEENAGFSPTETEAYRLRRDEVDEKDTSNEIATRENRNFPLVIWEGPENEEGFEVSLLRSMDPKVHLGQSSDEDKNNGASKADHSQPQ